MDVRIDEARNDKAGRGVDFPVDVPFKFFTNEDDSVAFVNEFRISPEIMPIVAVANEPPASNACPHLKTAFVSTVQVAAGDAPFRPAGRSSVYPIIAHASVETVGRQLEIEAGRLSREEAGWNGISRTTADTEGGQGRICPVGPNIELRIRSIILRVDQPAKGLKKEGSFPFGKCGNCAFMGARGGRLKAAQ
jgi:hypothetical protein